MSELRTSRRRFLAGAAAVAVPVALAPLKPWRALYEVSSPGGPAARLAGVLRGRRGARLLGRDALVALDRPGGRQLAAQVLATLPGGAEALARVSDDELRALLAAGVREDFAAERTVRCGGWVLSATEARLCALAALDARRRSA
jgi:hypothetical protein